jgi:hypothetical protein
MTVGLVFRSLTGCPGVSRPYLLKRAALASKTGTYQAVVLIRKVLISLFQAMEQAPMDKKGGIFLFP